MRRGVLIATLLLAGCQSLHLRAPLRTTSTDWLTDGGSPDHNHLVDQSLVPPLVQAWDYNAEAGFGPGSPLLVGSIILVGTRKGEVHAIDSETGKGLGARGFDDPIEGTLALWHGLLLVSNAWGNKTLHAYDLTRGKTVWSANTGAVSAGLLLVGDRLFVAERSGRISARDPGDGTEMWTRTLSETLSDARSVYATPLQIGDGIIAVADDQGGIWALREEDGSVVWQVELDAPVKSAPSSHEGLVFISTTTGSLFALDAGDGSTRWRFSVDDPLVRVGSATADGSSVYFGATDARVRSLSLRDGTLIWASDITEGTTAPPIQIGDVLYVGTLGNRLLGLKMADGDVVWTVELNGRVKSAMATRDGGLIVLTEPRHVLKFVEEAEYGDG